MWFAVKIEQRPLSKFRRADCSFDKFELIDIDFGVIRRMLAPASLAFVTASHGVRRCAESSDAMHVYIVNVIVLRVS